MQTQSVTPTIADEIRLLLLKKGYRSIRAWVRYRRQNGDDDFPSESALYHAISGRRTNATTTRVISALAYDTGKSVRALYDLIEQGKTP